MKSLVSERLHLAKIAGKKISALRSTIYVHRTVAYYKQLQWRLQEDFLIIARRDDALFEFTN